MESFLTNESNEDMDRTEAFESMIADEEVTLEIEAEQMEIEEAEEIDNEETESHEDSPLASKPKTKTLTRPKNGKRKRSSSCDSLLNEFEESAKIRKPLTDTNKSINVGDEFQACIPDEVDPNCSSEDREDPDEQLWETPEGIDEEGLKEFVKEASDRYRVPIDRALWILTKENFNFESAILEIAQRKEHRDLWTDEEVRTFHNSYSVVGKHFVTIRQMLPHRSLQSIVQYYYDNKKRITYNNFVDLHMNEGYSSDEAEEKTVYPETLFEVMCENCGEQAEKLQMNRAMNREECKACFIYYQKMNVPRPTSLRLVLGDRLSNSISCPEHMKPYMFEYEKLIQKSTGSTYVNRKMGKDQTVEDIIGNRTPSPYVKEEEQSFSEESDESLNLNDSFVSDTLEEDGVQEEEEEETVSENFDDVSAEPEVAPETNGDVALEAPEKVEAPEKAETSEVAEIPKETENPVEAEVPEHVEAPEEVEALKQDETPEQGEATEQSEVPVENGISNGTPPPHSLQDAIEIHVDVAATEEKPSSLVEHEPSTSKTPEPYNETTPEIWQKVHTRCMEESEVLSDDSRRKLFGAYTSTSRVNGKEVARWRSDMSVLHNKMERMNGDFDLLPSILMSRERVYYEQEWSDYEKKETIRLLHWYGKSFHYIADVLGNKSRAQVKEFYEQNKEHIDKVLDELRAPEESIELNGLENQA